MAGLTTRVGNVKLTSRLPEIGDAIRREAEIRVREMATVVRSETLRVLSGPRHGRMYPIPGTGYSRAKKAAYVFMGKKMLRSGYQKKYQASAPGEAPAVRLARLRQSIRTLTRMNRVSATAWVGSDLEYAPWLEKGTKRMAPRPFLIVAMQNMLDALKIIATRKVPL